MIIPIPSKNRRFRILVGIKVYRPMELIIKASDMKHSYSCYFRRKVVFNHLKSGKEFREIIIPMPISPEMLSVEISERYSGKDDHFEVVKFEVEPMPTSEVWAQPEIHDFIEFAQTFAQKAGYVKPGFYDSEDQKFLIQYLSVIKDQYNNRLVTPARTNRMTGRIQVSKEMFKKFTIPIRFFILLHERQHFQIPTRQEKPADLAALQLYLDLGFPKIEAIYATTKVFRLHSDSLGYQHIQRARDIDQFIRNHQSKTAA